MFCMLEEWRFYIYYMFVRIEDRCYSLLIEILFLILVDIIKERIKKIVDFWVDLGVSLLL